MFTITVTYTSHDDKILDKLMHVFHVVDTALTFLYDEINNAIVLHKVMPNITDQGNGITYVNRMQETVHLVMRKVIPEEN
ncbi:hypothetical protein FDI69_gp166 [Rhodococcus phage Trina]|uniref:Uncharacterized protein n=1 Tax=Rhodococcus phage Trina TaxID=2027905 RepID=A0A2D1A6Z8_9CAUD|nr:hypothetical protein FDI69_gp166 [Rhodococcus phage Trina]ASZ75020.1 hypothetical protein SEA_TRINA_241 [Rhodococcus phage Trina]